MKRTVFIEGMSCGHCTAHVEKALNALEGVSSAQVDLKKKLAVAECTDAVTEGAIREAVEAAGYDVTGFGS